MFGITARLLKTELVLGGGLRFRIRNRVRSGSQTFATVDFWGTGVRGPQMSKGQICPFWTDAAAAWHYATRRHS